LLELQAKVSNTEQERSGCEKLTHEDTTT